jgi:rod shape-determining protein MreD
MPVKAARPPDPLRWFGLPILVCVIATLILALPIRIFGFSLPQPVLPLAAVFAWALVRPAILAPFAVLLLGLFLDLFWGGPMGLWGLAMLAAYGAVLWTRPIIIGQPYPVLWAWYAAAVAIAMLIAFLVSEVRSGSMPSLMAVGWQYLVTALMFPLCHEMMDRFGNGDSRLR